MGAASKGEIEIEPMSERDLDSVLQIERVSFPTPWSRGLFERELLTSFARSFVAREKGTDRVVGYLCQWVVAEEGHILNLAVAPERQRQGIGTLLLRKGIEDCWKKGAKEITLEVRRSNYKAIFLYRNFQFQPRGIRPRYYTDSGEDAVIMGRDLTREEMNGTQIYADEHR